MIDLYTAKTPNGWKIAIMLEELELPYKINALRLDKNEQKDSEFLKINPNGKIPAIVDHDNGDFAVFESGAILLYLAEKSGKFLPRDPKGRSSVEQWLMFQMANVGPMMGQLYHFKNYAPEKIEYAINRYEKESERIVETLDKRLQESPYLAGDYSIADIATYPWLGRENPIIPLNKFSALNRWLKEIGKRPAVKKGMTIPSDSDYKK